MFEQPFYLSQMPIGERIGFYVFHGLPDMPLDGVERKEVIDYILGFENCGKSAVDMASMDDHILLNYGYTVVAASERALMQIELKGQSI